MRWDIEFIAQVVYGWGMIIIFILFSEICLRLLYEIPQPESWLMWEATKFFFKKMMGF